MPVQPERHRRTGSGRKITCRGAAQKRFGNGRRTVAEPPDIQPGDRRRQHPRHRQHRIPSADSRVMFKHRTSKLPRDDRHGVFRRLGDGDDMSGKGLFGNMRPQDFEQHPELQERLSGRSRFRDRDYTRPPPVQRGGQSVDCIWIDIVHEMQPRRAGAGSETDIGKRAQRLTAQGRATGTEHDDIVEGRPEALGNRADFRKIVAFPR